MSKPCVYDNHVKQITLYFEILEIRRSSDIREIRSEEKTTVNVTFVSSLVHKINRKQKDVAKRVLFESETFEGSLK